MTDKCAGQDNFPFGKRARRVEYSPRHAARKSARLSKAPGKRENS